MEKAGTPVVRRLLPKLPKLPTLRRRRVLAVTAGVLVLAAVATFATGAGEKLLGGDQAPPAAAVNSQKESGSPAGFVEFRQPDAGFALSYPADWTRLESGDPEVVLVASHPPTDSVQVRVMKLDAAVGPKEILAARRLTDGIVKSGSSVKMLTEPRQITLAGLPGYFYFYSFVDPISGQPGAHSHFFLFKGQTMITVVFQSIPVESFPPAATVFDQITQSFRVL